MSTSQSPPTQRLVLPAAKIKTGYSLQSLRGLIYGPKKFGKSELMAEFPDGIFIGTEGGLDHLSVYKLEVADWTQLLEAAAMIARDGSRFSPIILDTADAAFQMCRRYICAKYRVDHETQIGSGGGSEGYMLVNDEFKRVLDKLQSLRRGLWMVCHETETTIKEGIRKTTKSVVALPGKAREFITGLADLILYCDWTSSEDNAPRCLRTKAGPSWEGGGRVTGLPETIVYPPTGGAAAAFQVLKDALEK